MKESSGQRLALEAGDIDIARNLEPGDFDAVAKNADLGTTECAEGHGLLHQPQPEEREPCRSPRCSEAFKYLVDYDAIGSTIIKGIGEIHQSFLPKGVLGALDENPYKFDVAKAKELLAKAGLADGFTVTMDVRNGQPVTGIAESFQQTLGTGRREAGDHPGRRQADADEVPRPQPRHVYRPVGHRTISTRTRMPKPSPATRTTPTKARTRRLPGAMPGTFRN
ncbi:ABC transporter substrate-binding protein [Ensifer canadensis]